MVTDICDPAYIFEVFNNGLSGFKVELVDAFKQAIVSIRHVLFSSDLIQILCVRNFQIFCQPLKIFSKRFFLLRVRMLTCTLDVPSLR